MTAIPFTAATPAARLALELMAPKVELYWWEGCPSTPETLALLEEVLAERGVAAEVEVHEVTSDAEATVRPDWFVTLPNHVARQHGRVVRSNSRYAVVEKARAVVAA